MKIVRVKNFPNRIVAEQAQQSLEAEGIPSIIQSPDIGIAGPGGVSLPQGADLYVPEEFEEEARKILVSYYDDI